MTDTRDLYKLVVELDQERDDIVNLYDSVDLELNEGFAIETGVVGFTKDGIILEADETTLEFLDLNDISLEESDVAITESKSFQLTESRDYPFTPAGNSVLRRISTSHPELFKYGPEKLVNAIHSVTDHLTDLEEIGTSDVSIWVNDVHRELGEPSIFNKHSEVDEGHAYSDRPYVCVHPKKGKCKVHADSSYEAVKKAAQKWGLKSTSGIDAYLADVEHKPVDEDLGPEQKRVGQLGPTEKVKNNNIGKLVGGESVDPLRTIKKLALGESELDEGLKGWLAGAALLATLWGVEVHQAKKAVEASPQIQKLIQLHQRAEHEGDPAKIKELEDRLETAKDHFLITGREIMNKQGEPVDPTYEAKYQGREVPLGKPMQGDVKKSKVYVRKPNGKVVKVNFGDKTMRIKKNSPSHRKSFRARHHCENPGPRWKARYWSCRAW